MDESKRVVVVGIAGVGKTSLLNSVVKKMRKNDHKIVVCSFGTAMLDEAKKNGVTNRDDIRRMTISEQKQLQNKAARFIMSQQFDILIIDTHAFVKTDSGYYPGLPERVLRIFDPTNYVSVSAKPEEIYNRRMNDPTRKRDKVNLSVIKQELDLQAAMVSTYAIVSGAPVKPIVNREGKLNDAADDVIRTLGL